MINLHEESLYISGAIDMFLRLMEHGKIDFCCFNIDRSAGKVKEEKGSREVYNKCIKDFLLSDRDNIRRFLQGDTLEYFGHERDKCGKFIKVKVKFKEYE